MDPIPPAPTTHHSSSVSLHELHDAGGVFVPQVDVSTVAAAHHKLAAWPVEVHPLHWETGRATGGGESVSPHATKKRKS